MRGPILFAIAAIGLIAIIAGICLLVWSSLAGDEQDVLAAIAHRQSSVLVLGAVALLGAIAAAVRYIYAVYMQPLTVVTEETRVIAMSNPKHRIEAVGSPELRSLVGSINVLAERYQSIGEDVDGRIRDANAAVAEEKNTLAALMAKLTQGVLVCNLDGRILLYNQRAQMLLEGPARERGGGDWIGLGRSIYGIFDEQMIRHALGNLRHRLDTGGRNLLVPLVVSRPGGQLLGTHVVPILDAGDQLRGYILTLEDVTRRVGTESRRGLAMKELTEGYRSGVAGIRAAVETVMSYPDLDEKGRAAFMEVIRDEAMKMSGHLDRIEGEHKDDLSFRWPLEHRLGSDLLGEIERALEDGRALQIEVTAPVEPVWLQVDGYALAQCFVYLTDQLTEWCRAAQLSLTLEHRRSLAAFQLEWTGAVLDMEALRAWGLRNVPTGSGGEALSLFEIVERHGGALWADRARSGRPCLRLILPVGETVGAGEHLRPEDAGGHDFDFHLFDQPSHHDDAMTMPLSKLSFTVFDTETTGLDPSAGDEIIALGAVRIVNGRILHQEFLDKFIRPGRRISEASQAVHGITPDMLRGKPTIDQVLPVFRRFVEDTVIVGHNVAFDMRFLEVQGAPFGLKFDGPTLDTLLMECVLNPNQQDKSLEGIAGRFGISVSGRHTALGDALATAQVFLSLIPLLEQRGIHTLAEACAACKATPFAQIKY
ncbi:MAG: exonuclease domain-containing protein [Rhodospirillales bacterium]